MGEVLISYDLTRSAEDALLYPRRQRCRRCRRFLGVLVIFRLFCSYDCADLIPPDLTDVTSWPRQCRTRVGEPKRPFLHPAEAAGWLNAHGGPRRGEIIHIYECAHCGMYHIGHRAVPEVNVS